MDTLFPGRVSLFFVLFCFPVQSERRSSRLWLVFSVVDAGSVGYLSPSHHFLANLRLPREPGNEAMPHRESKKQAHRRAGLKWALADAEES